MDADGIGGMLAAVLGSTDGIGSAASPPGTPPASGSMLTSGGATVGCIDGVGLDDGCSVALGAEVVMLEGCGAADVIAGGAALDSAGIAV